MQRLSATLPALREAIAGLIVQNACAPHSGSAKATMDPPAGRFDFPPPAEITTY